MLSVVQVVHQRQCNEHCLCDSVQAQQLKQQLRSAQVAGQWRGDTALTLPLFHCSGGGPRSLRSFSGGFRGGAFTLSSPSHSVPVPNRPSRLRGRKAPRKQKQKRRGRSVQLKQISKLWKCLFGHCSFRILHFPDTPKLMSTLNHHTHFKFLCQHIIIPPRPIL